MAISRVTAVWSGFMGSPGYTNFFFDAFGGGDQVDLEVARVRSFFDAMQLRLPADVSIQVSPEAAILDEVTGELIGYANAGTTPSPVNGSAAGAYSAPSGGIVSWQTDTVAKGRRLRGRTFVVPLSNGAYEDNGTLSLEAIGDLTDGAESIIGDGTGPELVIWSRPDGSVAGSIGAVTGFRVPDLAAVLRSRRD